MSTREITARWRHSLGEVSAPVWSDTAEANLALVIVFPFYSCFYFLLPAALFLSLLVNVATWNEWMVAERVILNLKYLWHNILFSRTVVDCGLSHGSCASCVFGQFLSNVGVVSEFRREKVARNDHLKVI